MGSFAEATGDLHLQTEDVIRREVSVDWDATLNVLCSMVNLAESGSCKQLQGSGKIDRGSYMS